MVPVNSRKHQEEIQETKLKWRSYDAYFCRVTLYVNTAPSLEADSLTHIHCRKSRKKREEIYCGERERMVNRDIRECHRLAEFLAKHMVPVAFVSYSRTEMQNPVVFNNWKKVKICANSRTAESEHVSMLHFIPHCNANYINMHLHISRTIWWYWRYGSKISWSR